MTIIIALIILHMIVWPLVYLYFKRKYHYIISDAYYAYGKVHLEKYVRYNNFAKRFEYVNYYDEWNDYTLAEDPSDKEKIGGYLDVKEYKGKLFVNNEIVEKYISAKQKANEKYAFKVTDFTKYDRISANVEGKK